MQYEWTVDINVTCNDKGLQTPSTPQRDLNVKNKLDESGSRPGFTFSLFSLVSLSCISSLSFKIHYVSGKFLWRMRGAAMKTLRRLLLVLIIPIRAKSPEGSDTSIQLSYLETEKKQVDSGAKIWKMKLWGLWRQQRRNSADWAAGSDQNVDPNTVNKTSNQPFNDKPNLTR